MCLLRIAMNLIHERSQLALFMRYGLVCNILSQWALVLAGEWDLISQSRTTYLEVYKNYIDAVLMHFDVPEDSVEAMFEFRASVWQANPFFSCDIRDVEVHLQFGSPPVINPDGSKFPSDFALSRRELIHKLVFNTDKAYKHINITSPIPGSYFAAVFHPYINPKDQGITQDGLFPVCNSFIDASVYVKQLNVTTIVSEQRCAVEINAKEIKLFKIYIPEHIFKVILVSSDLKVCDSCRQVNVSVYSSASSTARQESHINATNLISSYRMLGDSDYYFQFANFPASASGNETTFSFYLKLVEAPYDDKVNVNVSQMYYTSPASSITWKYSEFDLHKSQLTESFQFTYELEQLEDGSVPIEVNITSQGFSSLKFPVRDVLDVGGTLHVALAFAPKLRRKGRWIYIEEEPKEHTVVACIRRADIEVPIWKQKCMYVDTVEDSPLILNSSVKNASFAIPYPEPGNWYLTLKLFCGDCKPCNCSQTCRLKIEQCLYRCEADCERDCFTCQRKCERKVIRVPECADCDCDGNCRAHRPVERGKKDLHNCNSSILFDISSYPCSGIKCGSNGKCLFGLAEGFVYSTCVCTNNYKGWDCSDDTNASTLLEIWLELLLLVLSNFPFGITAIIAYRRRYFVEALVYSSILVSSTFYHACDAGEHRINFCILDLPVLQFCDFYCAILSIWVTLIAMAYLPPPFPHLMHVGGAISLGAAITLDKTSLWVFVIPVTIGVVVVLASWAKIYCKTRQVFPSKTYLKIFLPSGLIVALIALIAFALFETQSNYKYVHSLWHIMMAVAVFILLPKLDQFLPPTSETSNSTNSTNQ